MNTKPGFYPAFPGFDPCPSCKPRLNGDELTPLDGGYSANYFVEYIDADCEDCGSIITHREFREELVWPNVLNRWILTGGTVRVTHLETLLKVEFKQPLDSAALIAAMTALTGDLPS